MAGTGHSASGLLFTGRCPHEAEEGVPVRPSRYPAHDPVSAGALLCGLCFPRARARPPTTCGLSRGFPQRGGDEDLGGEARRVLTVTAARACKGR